MKVLFEAKFYGPDLSMNHPGVREVPDEWEELLPTSAKRVDDNTPTSSDEFEPDEPQTLNDLARLTAQEGQTLRRKNSALKGQVTKQRNRINAMLEQLAEKGINIDLDADGGEDDDDDDDN